MDGRNGGFVDGRNDVWIEKECVEGLNDGWLGSKLCRWRGWLCG